MIQQCEMIMSCCAWRFKANMWDFTKSRLPYLICFLAKLVDLQNAHTTLTTGFFKAARYVFATKIIYKHAHNFTSALYHQTTTLHDAIRMPEISVALRRQITATRTKVRSPSESETSVQPLPSTSECDPLELVYNIRTSKFRTLHRSKLLTRDLKNVPLVKMQANMPPLLVDGRMLVRMGVLFPLRLFQERFFLIASTPLKRHSLICCISSLTSLNGKGRCRFFGGRVMAISRRSKRGRRDCLIGSGC